MSSELEVLEKIWENDRKTSIKLISNQTGFGLDYIRYICNSLTRKGLIKSIGKRGWYKITAKGEKDLRERGVIKTEVSRRVGGIKKVILPWSRKLLMPKPPRIELKSKLLPFEEKKLKLGKRIEKAASFLRRV